MRGQRNFAAPDGERVLGKAQLDRFLAWLSGTQAKVIMIVSPVPIVHARSFIVNTFDLPLLGIADDLRDEWEHASNWTERDLLLNAVFECSNRTKRQVVFLSGDVHISASFKLFHRDFPGALVHQLTSSGITYAALSPLARQGLRFVVAKRGTLGYPAGVPNEKRVHFTTLHTYQNNHFAIVRYSSETASVAFDVFGASEDSGAITKLQRIEL
jgi:alkaline phosphatase D